MTTGRPASRQTLRRDAEANRAKILAAAGRLFAEHGLGVGHDQIAHEAGVAVGTVYRRFPDKPALIAALFTAHVDRTVAAAEACLEVEDPWEAIVRFLTMVLEVNATNRGLRELASGSPHGQELAGYARKHLAPVVRQLVARGHAAGVLRPEIVEQDLALVPVMIGAITRAGHGREPDLWRRPFAIILAGLHAGERTGLPGTPPTDAEIRRLLGGRPH